MLEKKLSFAARYKNPVLSDIFVVWGLDERLCQCGSTSAVVMDGD